MGRISIHFPNPRLNHKDAGAYPSVSCQMQGNTLNGRAVYHRANTHIHSCKVYSPIHLSCMSFDLCRNWSSVGLEPRTFLLLSICCKYWYYFLSLSLSFPNNVSSTSSQVPVLRPMDLMVEATPRRIFSNAHTYHINSISVNSDNETYMSTDDLRINLWNLEITNRSFSILLHSDGWRQSQMVACLKNFGSLFFVIVCKELR